MKKNLGFALLLACLLFLTFSACDNSNKDLPRNIQPVTFGSITFPAPAFDKGFSELLTAYKDKYEAKEVFIGRPVWYTSDEDYKYWLKVEFLNPELGSMTFSEFGKEVAIKLLGHLTNADKFEKIEVSVIQKKGFIVTFSSSRNAFFYRDSLRQAK
jgi:hypothetical protein